MRLMLPKCPHCGKQVNWFRAWALKTQGEYRCGKCGECSNVSLDKALYPLAAVAAIAGAVFFVLFVTLVQEFSFTSLVLIAVPFLLFFLTARFLSACWPHQPAKDAAGCAGEGAQQPAPGQMHDTQRVDLPRGGQRQSQAPGRTARGAPSGRESGRCPNPRTARRL